jgi:murein L,D-transpeptidase YcbB/YkuD
LLWVDENGLSSRGRSTIEEIEKADDYGLRSSDYALPDARGFRSGDANATDWLADAEIKVSFAVLDYAHDARGGRIEPVRLSPNLDPMLALPNPLEVIESIALRSDPALSAELPTQSSSIRGSAAEAHRAAAARSHSRGSHSDPQIPDGPS